jgi:hypothetical protein
MAKGWLIIGFAAGYIAGSAAGRRQFERIKSTAQNVWERPEVQNTVKKADDFIAEKAPALHDVGVSLVESVDTSGSPDPVSKTTKASTDQIEPIDGVETGDETVEANK